MKISRMARRALVLAVFAALPAQSGRSAQLKPETSAAFDKYRQKAEQRMQSNLSASKFLWTDLLGGSAKGRAQALFAKGRAVEQCVAGCDASGVPVPGGLIHDWVGIVFVPGATLWQTLALVQNYDAASRVYSSHVIQSRILSRDGDNFRVFLRLKQTDFLSVVFDTEYEVHYVRLNALQAYSISRSLRIAQVANPGSPRERELPAGDDDGFLWRLNSYWRFEEKGGGVYIQCEAISLSRDIPAGLHWIVAPFIRDIPRNNLAFLLDATRKALLENRSGSQVNSSSKSSEQKGAER